MDTKSSSPERAPLVAHDHDETDPAANNYGATEDVEANKPAPGPEGKKFKSFREIAFLCVGLWTSVFCSALSGTVVFNLQIEIASYFKAASLSAWIGSSYLLGLAAMTPLWGRICEMVGRRTAMMCAITLFLAGTSLCTIAPSMYTLIGARAIAGMGSGGLLTVTAIIVSDLVSLPDRGLYQGGVNLLFGAGAALGSVMGGIVGDKLGWRYAFGLQIPFIIFSYLLIIWKVHVPMPKSTRTPYEKFLRVDWLGSASMITSVTCFMLAASLVTSSHYPMTNPVVLVLAGVAAVSVPVFVWAERKAVEPIMPLDILTRRSPALILVGFVLLTATNFSRLWMLPLYLRVVRGFSGSQTGLVLLPSSLVGSASSLYAGYYMRRYGEYKYFSIICAAVPALQSFWICYSWNESTNVYSLAAGMALAAAGGGGVITSLLTALIASVDPSEVSMAISACYLFRAIGQVLGVAISASLQQSVLASSLASRLGDQSSEVISRIVDEPTVVIPTLDAIVRLQAKLSYLDSFDAAFYFAGAGGLVLTLCCMFMRAYPLAK